MPRPGTDGLARSLEQIEADTWGPAPEGSTRLVERVHQLRRQPVGTLDVEELRLLVSQEVGLPTVVPLALRVVTDNALAEGDYYAGDLLVALLRVSDEHWSADPAGVALLRALLPTLDRDDVDYPVASDLDELVADFLRRHGG